MSVNTAVQSYTPKKWDLSGLQGISDETLQIHFGLYEGYVKNTNTLNERISELRASGKVSGADPAFAELVRRLGWEFDGMRLHEYYFDNMMKNPTELKSGRLYDLLSGPYGGFDGWKKEFAAIGGMRGIGWAIAYYDRAAGWITNHWINDHESGHISGSIPLVVLDVWEHAYLKDYKPAEKSKYIEAFFRHVDWKTCEERLTSLR